MLIDKDRRPVAAQLVQQIQRLIAEHGLKPGDKVPAQRELPASFGASRPTVSEAVLQLEMSTNRQFLVFLNAKTERVNVIYRRRHGDFGLIEPTFS